MTKPTYSPLPNLGFISVSGPDAAKFLQGQLTCDVTEVNEDQHTFGAYCDIKGRVQATFRLFKFSDVYYLLLPEKIIENIIFILQKYAVFSKVTLQNATSKFDALGLSILHLQENFSKDIQAHQISNSRSLLIGAKKMIQEIGKNLPIEKSEENWQQADIMEKIPHIYPETMGEFTVHHLNLTELNAISFSKGCYLGQEIVARTHYLGQAKQSLYLIEIDVGRSERSEVRQIGRENYCRTSLRSLRPTLTDPENLMVFAEIPKISPGSILTNREQKPIMRIVDIHEKPTHSLALAVIAKEQAEQGLIEIDNIKIRIIKENL